MDNIEKYIEQSSEKYYKWLVENHKGTMVLDIKSITPVPDKLNTYFLTFKKKLPDDGMVVKINDVIVLDEEYVIFDKTDFSFYIRLFNLSLEPYFADENHENLTIEYDLTFLVKRVEDYFKNPYNTVSLPRVKPYVEVYEPDFFPEMSTVQKNAVRNIFNSPLSYVWGAPGTGKTRMVLAFCAYKYVPILEDKEIILILAPTNVALEQSMIGILEMFEKHSVPIECVLRCGVPGHAYYKRYPETCEQANIAMLRETLDKVNIVLDMRKRIKICNSILDIQKKENDYKELLGIYKIDFEKLETKIEFLKSDSIALKGVVQSFEVELKKVNRRLFLKHFRKQKYANAVFELERGIAVAREKAISAEKEVDNATIEMKVLKEKAELCKKEIPKLKAKCKELIRLLFHVNYYDKLENRLEIEFRKINDVLSMTYIQFPEFENMTDDELVAYSDEIKKRIDIINHDDNRSVIGMTLDRFFATSFSKVKIKHIFLDEACYANAAKGAALFRDDIPLTMLGDHKQLPPVCELDKFFGEYKEAFLWAQSSLYCEQLFYNDPGKMRECFEQNYAPDFRYFSKSDLIETHRFGVSLANILERHAYKNGFKSVSRRSTQLYCIDASNEKMPLKKRESPSEAQAIKKFLDIEQPENFVILTPYVNQRILIKNTCGLDDDKVMTVHKSQGQEWDTVILSVTDTNNLWFTDSKIPFKKGLEVINTAVSRAKNRLIIVCDKKCWLKKEGQLISDIVKASEPIEL